MRIVFFIVSILQVFFFAVPSVRASSPTSAVAENGYVDAVLSADERAKYYENPVAYMEKAAMKDSLRAMELSLYYQGWNPEFVFFRFDRKIAQDLLSFPTKTEMRKMPNPPRMRDKKLALKWAEISVKGKIIFDEVLEFCNLANLLYSENPTKKEVERFAKIYSDFCLDVFCDAAFAGSVNYGCGGVYALAFRRGTMEFPVDMAMCEKVIRYSNHLLWRNFYTGFFVPQDREFAIYILSRSDDFWDKQALADIYRGDYDPRDANGKLADYWQKEADKAKESYIVDHKALHKRMMGYGGLWSTTMLFLKVELKKGNGNMSKMDILNLFEEKYNIIKYGAKRQVVRLPYYALSDDIVFAENNPNYNRKHAEKVLENLADAPFIANAIAREAIYEDILQSLEVDEDLARKFYEDLSESNLTRYRVLKKKADYRRSSLKKRDIN